jgi:hypothetical protein
LRKIRGIEATLEPLAQELQLAEKQRALMSREQQPSSLIWA